MELGTKIAEVRVNKLAANVVGTLLTLVVCVALVLCARMLPHWSPMGLWHLLAALVLLVLLPVAHEALHGIGLRRFAGVSWKQIRFGFMWRALMPYCHCTVPISLRAYRRMALLPLQATGTVALVALLAVPSDALGFFAGVTIAACIGDVWMVARLRRFDGDHLVVDSPSEIGCDVYDRPG